MQCYRQLSGLPEQHISPLLHKLHWLPVCIWVQIKMLVLIFEDLHCMGPDYLTDHLLPITSACAIRSVREGMLWVPSVRDLYLMGPRRWAFSALETALWNILPACPQNWFMSIFVNVPEVSQNLVLSSGLEIPGKK